MKFMSEDDLSEENLKVFDQRREILEKIKNAGISPDQALQALIDESYYLTQARITDFIHPDGTTQKQKQKIIDLLSQQGFNGHNKEIVEMANNHLRELKNLIKTNRS